MTTNFWRQLKKPILALAPLYHVTDFAFREVIAKYGKPDVMFTEFTSADGLSSVGQKNLIHYLKYSEEQRPIVAQIFGAKPETISTAVKLVKELGFDGVDINFGCPDKNIVKTFCGSGVIKNPQLAKEIISAAQESSDLPVSVKTRIGYNTDVTEEWIPFLLECKPEVLTVHGRTKKEMSKVPAHWDRIGRAVEIRNEMKSETIILGNGDVITVEDALEKVSEHKVDGVMIGRGIFGNPWRFSKSVKKEYLSLEEITTVLLEHTKLFEEAFKDIRPFDIMKKHFSSYLSGYPHMKELKMQLMETKSYEDVEKILK